jgi:hypothetical protein
VRSGDRVDDRETETETVVGPVALAIESLERLGEPGKLGRRDDRSAILVGAPLSSLAIV